MRTREHRRYGVSCSNGVNNSMKQLIIRNLEMPCKRENLFNVMMLIFYFRWQGLFFQALPLLVGGGSGPRCGSGCGMIGGAGCGRVLVGGCRARVGRGCRPDVVGGGGIADAAIT